MPTRKRFDGSLHVVVSKRIRQGIEKRIGKDGETQSEVMRKLLEIGLDVVENREKGV
jgi:hypothetical protein